MFAQEVDAKETAEYVHLPSGSHAGTPLFFAAGHGKLDIVKMLVEDYGVDPNKGRPIDISSTPDARSLDGASPLLVAAKMGHLPIVKYLMECAGAAPDLPMANGATPLTAAIQSGKMEVVAQLVLPQEGVQGADVNQPEDDGWTPLMLACLGGVQSGEVMAKFLFTNGAKRDAVAKDGTSLAAEVVRVTRQTEEA
jgi:ankyrin repeat protein